MPSLPSRSYVNNLRDKLQEQVSKPKPEAALNKVLCLCFIYLFTQKVNNFIYFQFFTPRTTTINMKSNPPTKKRPTHGIWKGTENHSRETQTHTELLPACKCAGVTMWCTDWCRPAAVWKYKNVQYHSEWVASLPSFVNPSCSPTLSTKSTKSRCLPAWPGCCFPPSEQQALWGRWSDCWLFSSH